MDGNELQVGFEKGLHLKLSHEQSHFRLLQEGEMIGED